MMSSFSFDDIQQSTNLARMAWPSLNYRKTYTSVPRFDQFTQEEGKKGAENGERSGRGENARRDEVVTQ